MISPDFRTFQGSTIASLMHSAKGSEWKKHKYVIKKAGKYYYPDSYEGGRHASNLDDSKKIVRTFSSSKNKITSSDESKKKEESKSDTSQTTNNTSNNLSKEDVERLAKEVIRGNYGNGQDRKDALGDDYQQIQNRVNEILLGSKKTNAKVSEVNQKEVEKVSAKAKSSGGINLDTVYSVYREEEKDKKKKK